ncbi:hypothetical protein MRX96_025927 [Rhipicephalus microplus]
MDALIVPIKASTYYIEYVLNRWISRFGVPGGIITDQAKCFVKTASLHRRLGIEHLRTPPQRYSTLRYDARREVPRFNIGDKVLYAIAARRWTLNPRFEGPYVTVGFRGKNIVLIRQTAMSRSEAERAVNIEQLRLYHELGDAAAELAYASISLHLGRGAEPHGSN